MKEGFQSRRNGGKREINMNFVEEIIKNTKENELRLYLEKISKASLEGRTDCFLTCSEGLMTKDTMKKIVNEYGFDLIITYHDIITTFVKCYFGDIASGKITIEHSSENEIGIDIDDFYGDPEKYKWNNETSKSVHIVKEDPDLPEAPPIQMVTETFSGLLVE